MPPSRSLQRQAACPCESGRRFLDCCLPWEAAFQRLNFRLLAFIATPAIADIEAEAASIFWNTQRPFQPGKDQSAAQSLRFLEWLLHDHSLGRGNGTLLAEFAEVATDLAWEEQSLLLSSLLAPPRAYEVVETLAPRSILVKDLLAGAERCVGPIGLVETPIRSDVLICRLVPVGRLMRPGASYLALPAAGREELLVYLRTTYRLPQLARHVSLEDFLDGAAHLYHHFFLHRGRDLGGRAVETLRRARFAPCSTIYHAAETGRIRAGLDRQSELERGTTSGEDIAYAWLDRERMLSRATVLLRAGEVEVRAESQEDLAEARAFLETCLRGLIHSIDERTAVPLDAETGDIGRPSAGPPGTRFLSRVFAEWPEAPSPLLGDQTPREACRSRPGRERVAGLLLDLERNLARLKRLGRPSIDLTAVREQLDLPDGQKEPARRRR